MCLEEQEITQFVGLLQYFLNVIISCLCNPLSTVWYILKSVFIAFFVVVSTVFQFCIPTECFWRSVFCLIRVLSFIICFESQQER